MDNYKGMGDRIHANKILHLSAIYIEKMEITISLCKKLLMIKSVIFYTY